MIAILCGVDGRPSMKAVYSNMETSSELIVRRKLKSGKIFFRHYLDNIIESFIKKKLNTVFNSNVIIRWGNRIDISNNFVNPIVYNNIKNIEKITNKKLSREILKTAGIKTPLYSDAEISEEIQAMSTLQYPMICRPLQHAKGKNFLTINSKIELIQFLSTRSLEQYYFAPYLEKTNEYRVHCGLGKVLSVLEKPKPQDINQKAWNRAQNGDPFTYIPWSDYNYDLCITALKACEAIGADFAAIDLIKFENEFYVLELNSSPTLISNEYTVERYAKLFDYIGKHTSDKKLKHWDFTKFNSAKSLAWKNFQLDSNINIINKEENE